MLHIKRIKPMYNSIVTTGEKYKEDMRENGLIVAKQGDLKLYQKVVAVGSTVRDIAIGDYVMISPDNYKVTKYDKNSLQNDLDNNQIIRYDLPWVTMEDENGEDQDYLLLTERDIRFVFEGEETSDTIIIPDKPKIITN